MKTSGEISAQAAVTSFHQTDPRVDSPRAVGRTPQLDRPVLALAWVVTLAVSLLPDVLLQTVTGRIPAWMFPAKLALLGVMIVTGFFWRTARPLRVYSALFLVLYVAEYMRNRVTNAPRWREWFAGPGSGFTTHMLGEQVLRVGVAAIMIAVLLLLRYLPRDFFLVKGDLNAPAMPVRWLGIDKSVHWRRLGIISSLCISLGLLTFLMLAGRPPLAAINRTLPFLPMVLLLAAMNAFAEEVSFRCALLAPLLGAVGQRQAVLLTAAYFGIAHYYGVPYGIIGVVMSGFLGWYLGKSMVETKGLFWPWFIHFLQDVLVFSFMAIGAVTPGGK